MQIGLVPRQRPKADVGERHFNFIWIFGARNEFEQDLLPDDAVWIEPVASAYARSQARH